MNKSNEMPELIAGRHVVITTCGKKGLVIADNRVIYFTGDWPYQLSGQGWDYLSNVRVSEVYDMCFNSDPDFLIWRKSDDKREQLRKEYAEMQKQMEELKRKMDEIGGEL